MSSRSQERAYADWIEEYLGSDFETPKSFLDEGIKLGNAVKSDTRLAPKKLLDRLQFVVGENEDDWAPGTTWKTWADISKHLRIWIMIDIEEGHFEGGIRVGNLPEGVAIPYGPGGYRGL